MSGNQALNVNSVVGQQADLQITDHGSDWYYTVCAIMTVATVAFAATAFMKPRSHRLFHYITAAITLVAAISYWCMGSNLGQVPIQVQFVRPFSRQVGAAGTREMFYVRYIDWFVTTPLLLLDLLLTAAIPWPTILITLLLNEVMIVTGLVGALTHTSYKWGFWVFAMAALFFITYQLVGPGRSHANVLGGAVRKTFMLCGVWLLGLWFLYPIAWGLSEGGNVIHPDSEAIFYGILDIFSKVGFGALLLWGHRKIDPHSIGMYIRDPGSHGSGGMMNEKAALHDGVTNTGVTGNNMAGTGAAAGTGLAGTHHGVGTGTHGVGGAHTGVGGGGVTGQHDPTIAGNAYGTGFNAGTSETGNYGTGAGVADPTGYGTGVNVGRTGAGGDTTRV